MAMKQLEEVRGMKFRKPFARFRILTTGGDKYLVEDRFQFAVGQTKMIYVFPGSDRTVQLGADNIAGVELVEQQPAA
jgi:hypothetical protein